MNTEKLLALAYEKLDKAYENDKIKSYTELGDILERIDGLTDEELEFLDNNPDLNETFEMYKEQVLEELEEYYEQEDKRYKRDRKALESEYRRNAL